MGFVGGVDQPQSLWAATLERDAEVASKCEKGGVASLTRGDIPSLENPRVRFRRTKGEKASHRLSRESGSVGYYPPLRHATTT